MQQESSVLGRAASYSNYFLYHRLDNYRALKTNRAALSFQQLKKSEHVNKWICPVPLTLTSFAEISNRANINFSEF